ncbi:unnamed protein product [Symbiodinium sp. CCMP2456]|nr:unnamed protein product [Symbiodinium sp. CCMP2456]
MAFSRAARSPPLRPESPKARACRERPGSLSPVRSRPSAAAASARSRASVASLASRASQRTVTAASSRFGNESVASTLLTPSVSYKSISRASLSSQSSASLRESLSSLITKARAVHKQLDVELASLQGAAAEVDRHLAATLRERCAPPPPAPRVTGAPRSLAGPPALEVSSREAVEASLGSLHEATAQCKMVLSHMEFLLDASTQALALQEPSLRNDRRPQSAPSHALQLQKQLAAKVQEARILVRDSAALAMQCLRSHGGRGGYAASAPVPPQPETPQPELPKQPEPPVAEPPQPEPPQTEMLQAKPAAAASRADMPMATVLECKVQDTPSADRDAEPPRTTTNCKPALEQEKPFWSQLGGVHWDEVEVLAAQWSP